jgi:hypothetical protein
VFILKIVKVLCFDTLLQVFILKDLYRTRIVHGGTKRPFPENGVPGTESKKRQQDAGVTGCTELPLAADYEAQYYPRLTIGE